MSPVTASTIGSFIREQREQAKISMRQLAQAAGVSNPYLSQVERGLRRPSADILQQIAKGLRISAEALYVQAGILDDRPADTSVPDAIMTDPELTERQKQMLIEIYESFRKEVRADAEVRAAADAELGPAPAAAPAAAASAEPAVAGELGPGELGAGDAAASGAGVGESGAVAAGVGESGAVQAGVGDAAALGAADDGAEAPGWPAPPDLTSASGTKVHGGPEEAWPGPEPAWSGSADRFPASGTVAAAAPGDEWPVPGDQVSAATSTR